MPQRCKGTFLLFVTGFIAFVGCSDNAGMSDSGDECRQGDLTCLEDNVYECKRGEWTLYDECVFWGKRCRMVRGDAVCEASGSAVEDEETSDEIDSASTIEDDTEVGSDHAPSTETTEITDTNSESDDPRPSDDGHRRQRNASTAAEPGVH